VPRHGPWPSHGFRTRCLRFVVQVAPPHAKLASGRWSGATGRAFHPQGSNERFQICFLHLFLPSQAFLAQSMPPRQVGKRRLWPAGAVYKCWISPLVDTEIADNRLLRTNSLPCLAIRVTRKKKEFLFRFPRCVDWQTEDMVEFGIICPGARVLPPEPRHR
jgi:hypothetical protein